MFGLRSVSCCVLPILDHTNLLGCLWRRTTPAWHQTPQPANLGGDFSLYRKSMPPEVAADYRAGTAYSGETVDKYGLIVSCRTVNFVEDGY